MTKTYVHFKLTEEEITKLDEIAKMQFGTVEGKRTAVISMAIHKLYTELIKNNGNT